MVEGVLGVPCPAEVEGQEVHQAVEVEEEGPCPEEVVGQEVHQAGEVEEEDPCPEEVEDREVHLVGVVEEEGPCLQAKVEEEGHRQVEEGAVEGPPRHPGEGVEGELPCPQEGAEVGVHQVGLPG